MELLLRRKYYPEGCNGVITWGRLVLCESIELPWRGNRRMVSCIPEGRYRLLARSDKRFGQHLAICNVPQREGILIHPANYALGELKGCIAPVVKCLAAGTGQYSRVASSRLNDLVYPLLAAGERVWLRIVAAEVLGDA